MRAVLVIIIILTCFGIIFFFPLSIDEKYTCLYHRVFDQANPVSNIVKGDHHSEHVAQSDEINSADTGTDNYNESENQINNRLHGSVLLDTYLEQYVLIWWVCVGLFGISLFWMKKFNAEIKN